MVRSLAPPPSIVLRSHFLPEIGVSKSICPTCGSQRRNMLALLAVVLLVATLPWVSYGDFSVFVAENQPQVNLRD